MECIKSCFRYHKGTDFQANHNLVALLYSSSSVVLDTTKVQIFKQITTLEEMLKIHRTRLKYRKSKHIQANHIISMVCYRWGNVVLDTTKVQIFKQITTVE